MLSDLRSKVRVRHSRISSCSFQDFLPLTKQFFDFVNRSAILKSVIDELLARHPNSVKEAQTVLRDGARVFGTTDAEAAAIGCARWQAFAAQDNPHAFYINASGSMREGLELYRDWYVEPLFDYLDETLDDGNTLLALLIRYKQKVEWYRKRDVLKIYEDDTPRGEDNLKWHMFEFLFDQGLPFHIEPTSATGKPDVVFLGDANHPFPGEVKIFDPERGKTAKKIKEGVSQTYRYCLDYNEPLGYFVVFNVPNKQLRFEVPSQPDGIPRFELNHKTIFLIVINLYDKGTASTLGIAETVTITAAELVDEVEESVKPKS